jgi:dsRNA-specific ribonuclease
VTVDPHACATVLQARWPSFDERLRMRPDALHAFHAYVLRVDGVRSERHLCLLVRNELPSLHLLPDLHVYPHGIRQRRVHLQHHDSGPVHLTHAQLTLAERWHVHAFKLLLNDEHDRHDSAFPVPPSERCWRAWPGSDSAQQQQSTKQYLLLPCVPKSAAEQAREAARSDWLYPDERDDGPGASKDSGGGGGVGVGLSDLEVQRELMRQQLLRGSLAEGHERPVVLDEDEQEEFEVGRDDDRTPPPPPPAGRLIDWAFIEQFLASDGGISPPSFSAAPSSSFTSRSSAISAAAFPLAPAPALAVHAPVDASTAAVSAAMSQLPSTMPSTPSSPLSAGSSGSISSGMSGMSGVTLANGLTHVEDQPFLICHPCGGAQVMRQPRQIDMHVQGNAHQAAMQRHQMQQQQQRMFDQGTSAPVVAPALAAAAPMAPAAVSPVAPSSFNSNANLGGGGSGSSGGGNGSGGGGGGGGASCRFQTEERLSLLLSARPVGESLFSSAAPRSVLLWTSYSGRLYVNAGPERQALVRETALSRFPKADQHATYADYYRDKWNIPSIPRPHMQLIAAMNFNMTPLNCLQPTPLSHKKKQQQARGGGGGESVLLLLPDATKQLSISAHFLFLLRLMPCILQRIEIDLLHAELRDKLIRSYNNCSSSSLATSYLPLRLQPYPLRMALTSGNAQEVYPLPFGPSHPGSVASLERARTIHAPKELAPSATVAPMWTFSYERLKFVGDSVLKLLLSKVLLALYPFEAEEGVTNQRGAMINLRRMGNLGATTWNLQRFVVARPFHATDFRPPGWQEQAAEDAGGERAAEEGQSVEGAGGVGGSPAVRTVSKHVLADVVSSLVGAAWVSGAECSSLALLCSFGILQREQVEMARINASLSSEALLAELAARNSKLQALLAAQEHVEHAIGYTFTNRALYVQAFSHERIGGGIGGGNSARGAPGAGAGVGLPSYERLELLGDAVLELCVSTLLTSSFSRCSSAGELTFLRQRLVNNALLAMHVRHSPLQPFVEGTALEAFAASSSSSSSSSSSLSGPTLLLPSLLGPGPPPKLLADVLEALIGAVYVDSGDSLAAAWEVYSRFIRIEKIEPYASPPTLKTGFPKATL